MNNKEQDELTECGISEIIEYDQDCLSRDFLTDLLMRVYIREIGIERAVNLILDDINYMKKNLIKD